MVVILSVLFFFSLLVSCSQVVSNNVLLNTAEVEEANMTTNNGELVKNSLGWKCEIKFSDNDYTLSEIQFLNERDGFAISQRGNILKTKNGGASWESISVGLDANSQIFSLYFISPEMGWVTSAKFDPNTINEKSNQSSIFKTTDGGRNWKEISHIESILLSKVKFLDKKEGWIIGRKFLRLETLVDQIYVLHTVDGGANWIEISKEWIENFGDFAEDIVPTQKNEAILLSAEKKIYKIFAQDREKILLEDLSKVSENYVKRIGITINGSIWAVGGIDSKEGISGTLLKKEGNKWKKFTLNAFLKTAVFISDNEAFISGHNITDETSLDYSDERIPFLRFSSDSGKTWIPVCSDKDISEVSSFSSLTNQSVWAVGGGKIIYLKRLNK